MKVVFIQNKCDLHRFGSWHLKLKRILSAFQRFIEWNLWIKQNNQETCRLVYLFGQLNDRRHQMQNANVFALPNLSQGRSSIGAHVYASTFTHYKANFSRVLWWDYTNVRHYISIALKSLHSNYFTCRFFCLKISSFEVHRLNWVRLWAKVTLKTMVDSQTYIFI